MSKKLFAFIINLFFIACNDVESGNAYAGPNSLQCHKDNKILSCIETNPLAGPIGELPIEDAIFGNGEVQLIDWESTVSWFLKSDNHHYGFDIDPQAFYPENIEKGQDVYISVEKGKKAKLTIRIDPKTKEIFHLHKINEKKDITVPNVYQGNDICKLDQCINEIELTEGTYATYYENLDKKRYVHVMSFSEDTKNIDFIQFGDNENTNCYYDDINGCYNRENVENQFNEIFAQAVVKGKFVEKKPSDFKLDEILYIDLTEKMNFNEYLSDIVTQIVMEKNPNLKTKYEIYLKYKKQQVDKIQEIEIKNNELDKCLENSSSKYACQNLQSTVSNLKNEIVSLRQKVNSAYLDFSTRSHHDAWRVNIVFGINEMSIGWNVPSNTLLSNIVLQNFSEYNNACTKYYRISYDEGCLNKRFPMYLASTDPNNSYQKIEAEMIDFDKKDNTFVLKLHNIQNTSNNHQYAIVADTYPIVPGFPYAIAYAAQIPSTISNGFPTKEEPCAILGGLVWGTHTSGENSLNTISHEIAHTYGMSDAYISESDPFIYKSTEETNLMNYSIPIGPKIRYRPMEVVYTSSNERIKKNGVYAKESQWLCIRDNTKCIFQ